MNFRQRLKNKDGQLRLRMQLLLLLGAPLVVIIAGLFWLVNDQALRLQQAQIDAVSPIVLQARKDEIQHFVEAGVKVLAHFCAKTDVDGKYLKEGLELLRLMDFGKKSDDNYFFIYDLQGVNVMHPRKRNIEGTSLWLHKDVRDGSYVIQRLIQEARAGGGFVDYNWDRPSTKQIERKLGYVELVPGCNLMIGTGLYLDHLREAEDAIRRKTQQEVETTTVMILWISLAAILLVAAGGLVVNLNEQRQANQKLRAMAQKVVQSQELERTRVARELHDGVTQSLASVKFIFESADIQLERGKFAAAGATLKHGIIQIIGALVDVRRISHDLYPTILDDQGLAVALEQLAREFSARTALVVDYASQGDVIVQKDVAKSLYRFAQQALGNIETHAKAGHIKVSLRLSKGILLRVEDDGVGFDPRVMQLHREGLGLTNMRERIEMLGGVFAVLSRPGCTVLKAYFPPESLRS
jgi:two-component system NarL family sensor kinase